MTWSSESLLRSSLSIAIGLLVVALPLGVTFAQGDDADDIPFRDCSEEALQEMNRDDSLGDAPATVDVLSSGLTPEEAAAVRQQIYDVQVRQIEQLAEMLRETPPGYERRADLLFRLAEAYWQVGDADYLADRALFNECFDDYMNCLRDEPCPEPIPDYSSALDQYEEILRDHPNYGRIDEVIFRLGDGLIKAEQASEGVVYLTRLVDNYPDSTYIAEARFLMGDYFFENDLLRTARQHYEEVLAIPGNRYLDFAIYKIGWIDINEAMFEDAVSNFQTVLANIDAAEGRGEHIAFDLRGQAINDMLVSWTEIDDGWQIARPYLLQVRDEDFMKRKLLAMSDLYDEKGKDQDRVNLLRWISTTYPLDSRLPQWYEYMADSLTKIGEWGQYEVSVREFVEGLEPSGDWSRANSDNEMMQNQARSFSETAFLSVITRNYQEAERLSRPELYELVADDYAEFFDRWADSDEAYEQRFFYAEVLYYNIQDYPAAGEQYLEVVRADTEGEHAHDSIIGALQAFDDLMLTEVPDINEDLQIMSSDELEAMRSGLVEEQELGPWSQRYVEVVSYFAELFPDDERIPVASWRAAEIFRRANRIGDAAERFETIIEHHPTHRFAEEAAISAFLCFQYVENWEKIEYWARYLLAANPDPEGTDLNPARLQQAVAYSINEQSQDLIEEGQDFPAAEMMLALYQEFPDSEFSPNALFNAAAIYERAREVETAVSTYQTFLNAYPEDPTCAEVKFTLGLIHDSQVEFATAADWFEAVDDHENYEERDTAILQAARLREAMSEFDDAIRLYDHYIEITDDEETPPHIYFIIAEVEEDRGNPDAAFDRYSQFRDAYPDQEVLRLIATVRQARIRDEQADTDEAFDLFESAYSQYGEGNLMFDEGGLPAGWEREPGWQFEDPEEKLAVLPLAAEARFYLAEADFEACRNTSLEYPEGRWRELAANLESRGVALQLAQKAMFEVYSMGDAAWSVAATTRIGELYKDFYEDMYNLPQVDLDECLDSGYSYDDCDNLDQAFSAMMYDVMYPIETKALESLSEALVVAHDNSVFSEYTQHAVSLIAGLDNSIRVIGEEGVEPENVGVLYTGTSYILDLTETLARMEVLEQQRQEALRAAQGGGAPQDAPPQDVTPEGEPGPENEEEPDSDGPSEDDGPADDADPVSE